ncbi:MAG: type VI secretion system tip protein TssI/VgrG [Candidatus Thiodiazotropha sp.]
MIRLDDGNTQFGSAGLPPHADDIFLRGRWKQNLLLQDFVISFKQANRSFRFNSPLGKEKLLLYQFSAQERLGCLFEYRAELLSDDDAIPLDALLGQRVDVELDLSDGGQRFFNAHVSQFTQIGIVGDLFHYQALLRPWPWFLSLTKDCRIYQKLAVPAILQEIFGENGFSDYELQLTQDYRIRDYTVQFNETDFDFISRLMEEEGIYYCFSHTAGKHTLVLCDNYASHSPLNGNPLLPFQPIPGVGGERGKEVVHSWKISKAVNSGCYVHTDYDFKNPRADLIASTPMARDHSHANYEVFDYPGCYEKVAEGENFARSRIEEAQARHERIRGQCDIRHLTSGALFTLKDHPRADQNREYLITEASYLLQADQYRASAQANESEGYQCEFTCIPSNEVFRNRRTTAKPRVEGPQSAVVVGPAGEEIYTDKFGRVKVQFHWDRYGKSDENSSCWVRVAQAWAGKNWGGIQIPRIGQEVIVEFLDGDLDRPIITGRVYNAEQMPPWGLPSNQTQSGILSRSTKGGTAANANAIRFEDKKGEEQLWLHAEKDQLTEVEHDEDKWVGNDRRKTIDHDETSHIKHDRTETVDNDETITIHNNRTERVDHNEAISIGDNRSENVGKNETISIGLNRSEKVGISEEVSIGSNRSVNIGGNKSETIAMAKAETIGLAKALSVGLGYQVTVGAAMNTTVALVQASEIGIDKLTKVGKKYTLTAGEEIELRTGKSVLIMKSDGTIMLKGVDISVVAEGEINVKAQKDIVMKGKNILEN